MSLEITMSNMDEFRDMLENPEKAFKSTTELRKQQLQKIKKNLLLYFPSDSSGCGHIRTVFPSTYLNSIFAKPDILIPIITPFFVFQENFLTRAKSIIFQRQMGDNHIPPIEKYKELQKKFKYKMIYDIDDFIWRGPDEGEEIPEYNFGSSTVTDNVRNNSYKIMNMMDHVTVSSQFLKDYISTHGVNVPITVIPNSIPKYFWGDQRKQPITKKIEKPKIIYTGSPCHWNEPKKLKGDFENAWCEYINKAVIDNKIDFMIMGVDQAPFMFSDLANRSNFHVCGWKGSYDYHNPIINYAPDFGISPLVRNYFNYSKSYIKYEEYCAVGAIGIGTIFTNGKPSPYDICQVKVKDVITVKEIEELIEEYSHPEKYNEIIKAQYDWMDNEGLWLEDPKFINRLLAVY